jgi:hypothetical protein
MSNSTMIIRGEFGANEGGIFMVASMPARSVRQTRMISFRLDSHTGCLKSAFFVSD